MKLITIITPTYNRCEKLNFLYNSLLKQTSKNFIWMIIDDGSVDETSDQINKNIEIEYFKKDNGGKHTALNLAFKNLRTELAFIVDSDDVLVENAIETIENDWKKYNNKSNICGLVYKKGNYNGISISDDFKNEEFEENYNSYIINKNIKGDKAEVFKSNILSKYSFPVYPGEKFIGEGVIWSKIAHDYNMIFFDKIIYECDYLEDGLTKSGRKMRIRNPLGGMYHAEEYLLSFYSNKVRIKNAILFIVYSKFAKIRFKDLLTRSEFKMLLVLNYLPSTLLYYNWKRKYR